MLDVLARNWWAVLIRGIAAVIFGILAFLWPGATIFAIVILFGAYALVDGVFALIASMRAAAAHERWWTLALEGIVGIIIGLIALFEPHVAVFALYLTIAIWAFATGIIEIVAAFHLRKHLSDELWLILGGIASVIFGVLLLLNPFFGALIVIWIIGAYAIIFGILMLGLAARLRRHATR